MQQPSKTVLAKIHSLKGKKGIIAVIDPKTGDYFLGKTLIDAIKKAKKKYPANVFYTIRVGYLSAHEHKGGIKKL